MQASWEYGCACRSEVIAADGGQPVVGVPDPDLGRGLGGVVVVLKVMLNDGPREQRDPTPNGYGIVTFPHRAGQPGSVVDAIASG
ncbi:hypothetical protein SASPL_136849 [Salvia splendens]|uniref:Uncharacterized protein n=1 Tax=Salvia splendens TaxID=180675 RepID=A0A8X8X1M4_SALSN|nr:hypothetical protein SASPL_136849 [Salvia splendens]